MAVMKTLSDGENVFTVQDPNAVVKTEDGRIADVADPVEETDAVNKKYVDGLVSSTSGTPYMIEVFPDEVIKKVDPSNPISEFNGQTYELDKTKQFIGAFAQLKDSYYFDNKDASAYNVSIRVNKINLGGDPGISVHIYNNDPEHIVKVEYTLFIIYAPLESY